MQIIHLSMSSFKLKNSIFRVIFFIGIFFLIDNVIYSILHAQYNKISSGPGRYNFIKGHRFDALIMGSSTSKAFLDEQIGGIINRSILNVSLDGSALLYSRCLIDLIIQNEVKPKMIILGIDYFEIQDNAWGGNYYANVEKFAPLYGDNSYIDRALTRDSIFGNIKYGIKSFRFNNLLFALALRYGRLDPGYSREKPSDKTLVLPINPKTMEKKFNNYYSPDARKIQLFEDIIEECDRQKINLFFIVPPVYYPDHHQTERDKQIERLFKEMTARHHVPFSPVNQENYPIFRDPSLFEDVLHLNTSGAEHFSDITGNYLLKMLNADK